MELKNFELKDSSVNMDERTFEGYASTWDKDQTDDVIHYGAFTKSITEAFPAKRIKVLWQHSQPLGMPTEMREDAVGLYVKGRVSKTALGDEALELMRDGVVDRMSIGFSIPQGKSDYDEEGIRHIREVKLMEFSPVTFPANEAAIITGVKMINDAMHFGASIQDIPSLAKAIDELKALITKHEPQSTQADNQPPVEDIEAILAEIKKLGDIRLIKQ
jgi:HK97 family phage prohead protease